MFLKIFLLGVDRWMPDADAEAELLNVAPELS